MKAGRGYIIRFFDEKNNLAIYYRGKINDTYGRERSWSRILKDSKIFLTHEEAVSELVSIKKETNKVFKNGYLYISKVFYQEVDSHRFGLGRGKTLFATKLTKPDRHDFLQAI